MHRLRLGRDSASEANRMKLSVGQLMHWPHAQRREYRKTLHPAELHPLASGQYSAKLSYDDSLLKVDLTVFLLFPMDGPSSNIKS